ncbi:MAG: hypothetical protein H6657_24640 [Ardenticatenaceae bacterium]|nr:hypothetical protein [Ardenticatenaceae bacterium]
MVSNATITKGDIVKIHNWYGVVLETHYDIQNHLSVIQVQTARNVFRGHGPEYLDVRLMPEAIGLATPADLQQEIETHQRLLDGAVERMMKAVTVQTEMPVAAD